MPVHFALLAISNLSAGTPITDVASMFAAVRRRAIADAMTGIMAFDGAGFCIYLEGPREAVQRCHEAVGLDSRHAEMEAVCLGVCETRRFTSFMTGYAGADGLPASEQLRPLDGDDALPKFIALAADFDLQA